MRYLLRPNETLKQSLPQASGPGSLAQHLRLVAVRCIPAGIFFAIAFAIDQLTHQQYSAILGSAAIAGSLLSVFPALRAGAIALGGYGAIWLGFNLARAVADDAGLAMAGRTLVSSVETRLFGGTLPSQWLQERFHDPDQVRAHDLVLALVHASFFITPFVLAVMLYWKRRAVFHRYCLATAFAFGLGLVGFLLLPTAPPWLSDPDTVTRVTVQALSMGNDGVTGTGEATTTGNPRLAFEPNHVAAMPSVHVAAAVLVFLAMRRTAAWLALPGAAYALAMTLAVVYLGEHFLLDALVGWAIALVGWQIARRFAPPQGLLTGPAG